MITAKQTRIQTQALPLPKSNAKLVKQIKSNVRNVLLASAGFAVALLVWQVVAIISPDLPSPMETLPAFWSLISNPFYDNGPNDKGVGIQVAFSLWRVFSGWAAGSLIAIPLGIMMGSNKRIMQALNPLVQILRPVSPLAWYPIGLAAYHSAASAVVFAIVITSLWPTLINTMFGISSLPKDYRDVARVFRFSKWKYLTKVLLPYSLPHILTGLRLSLGIAWMVIVAAEMLAGGTGIGFFVWDSWNALSLTHVISAILIIGIIGLIMDRCLEAIIRKVSFTA